MVGEGLIENQSYNRLNQTPWSLPTYLNDVMASYYEWMGDSQRDAQETSWRSGGVLAPTGSRDPFYFLVERYSGGSDHDVFVDGTVRIPAVLMIVWPDQWYHSSGDTPDKSDATQFKTDRDHLARRPPSSWPTPVRPKPRRMMAEISARQGGRLGADRARAERLLLAVRRQVRSPPPPRRPASSSSRASPGRRRRWPRSASSSAGTPPPEGPPPARLAGLDAVRASHLRTIDDLYAARCRSLGVPAAKPAPTKDEIRLAGLVPVRTEKMGGMMAMWGLREEFRKLDYQAPPSIQMAEMELRNFIDGKRSILDIRDAASAEFEPLDLLEVEKWVGVQEKVGLVTIRKK